MTKNETKKKSVVKKQVVKMTMVTRGDTRKKKKVEDYEDLLPIQDTNVKKVKLHPSSSSASISSLGTKRKKWNLSSERMEVSTDRKQTTAKKVNAGDKKKKTTVKDAKVIKKKTPEKKKVAKPVQKKKEKEVKSEGKKTKPAKQAGKEEAGNEAPKNNNKKETHVKLTTRALKKHEMRNDELITIRPPDRGESWDGNSQADGSVNSGVLDENVCFACGKDTTSQDSLRIVICDICGGDYHFSCVGLTILPRLAYKCPDCVHEVEWNKLNRKTHDDVLAQFPLSKKRKSHTGCVCYSPARPLSIAWEECLDKGFMMVQKVFSFAVIDKLISGSMQRMTKYGRVAESWTERSAHHLTDLLLSIFNEEGAASVLSDRLKMSNSNNVVNRDGRLDIKIPKFVVDELQLETLLEPILSKLRTIMSPFRTPRMRTHNVIFAPVGSPAQEWHYDDSKTRGKYHSYFTILIHLNSIDDLCGGTEIWSDDVKRGDLVRGRPGDAFVFNGSLLHRGQGNTGSSHRWFYYASFSCSQDANEVRS